MKARSLALLTLPFGLLVPLVAGCHNDDDDDNGGGGGQLGATEGTVVTGGTTPLVGADVRVFDDDGDALPEFDTRTNGNGRWQVSDLREGTYEIEFVPQPAQPELPPVRLREVVIEGNTTTEFRPVSLPPILGGALVENPSSTEQAEVRFRSDPFDAGSSEPLPGLMVTIPPDTEITIDGDIPDDADPSTQETEFLLQIGLIAPELLPVPFVDEDGNGRANQLFFTLQPAEARFSNPIQVTYPNVNGLAPGSPVQLYRFDEEMSDWVQAGTGTVDPSGTRVEPDAGAGLPRGGWHVAPGDPPPTTTLCGQVTKNGQPFARADIAVVTSSGFFGLTDETGLYQIDDVPLIGGSTELICRAFTDSSLAFEVASDVVAPVPGGKTRCDIEIQGTEADVVMPGCDLLEPANDSQDVARDTVVRVVFDELMTEFTVEDALSVRAGGNAVDGELVLQTVSDGTGHTEATFIPDGGRLPADSTVTVEVSTDAEDQNGNPLAEACRSSFETGTTVVGMPLVLTVEPQSGGVGTVVTLRGLNLESATDVTFGDFQPDVIITPDSVSETAIVFTVPAGAGIHPPGTVDVTPSFGVATTQNDTASFTLLPSIESIDPPMGAPGTLVTIVGHNLEGDSETIEFGAAQADALEVGPQEITVSVPAGATSGPLRLLVSAGTENDLAALEPVFFTLVTTSDTEAPVFVSSDPADMETGVFPTTPVVVLMSEHLAQSSTLTVTADGDEVEGVTTVSATGSMGRLTFTADDPGFPLDALIEVSGGPSTIHDLAGNGAVAFDFSFQTGQPCDGLDCLDDGQNQLTAGHLQSARGLFAAVAADPSATAAQEAEANLYLAGIDLALAFDKEGTGPAAVAFHALLEDFGFPAGGPDLFHLEQFTLPDELPADSPNCQAVLEYVRAFLIPTLESAEADFAALPASVLTLFPVDGDEEGGSQVVEIDGTDVLAARTALEELLFDASFVSSYGCALDVDKLANSDDALQPNEDFLDADPTFLALDGPNDRLMEAQTALLDMIARYSEGLASLQAETDDQSDDLVIFAGDTPQEMLDAEANAGEVEDFLEQVMSAVLSPPETFDLSNGFQLHADLSTPFTTLDLRSELPVFEDGKEHPALATLTAPVLNAIFPNLTALQANAVLRLLFDFGPAPIVADGTIDLDDASTTDWGATPSAAGDPVGSADLTAELSSPVAVDIENVFVVQESDDYFFRVDFDSGTPSAATNSYVLSLDTNVSGSPERSFTATIENDGGGTLALTVRQQGSDRVEFGPDSDAVQAGNGFLELRIPKSVFSDNLVDDGTEYAISFEARDSSGGTASSDEAGPIKLVVDLP